MIEHLRRHGLHPNFETLESGLISVADTVLLRAKEIGAAMIVMGAYGHSRLRETILGGVTHDMLRNMTRPLLMSH